MSDSSGQTNIDENTEWWELLIWENMHSTWRMLPMEIRMKLRDMGKAPSWDKYNSSSTTIMEEEK